MTPTIIDHAEISPTGGCRGALVKDHPHGNIWRCTNCGASYTGGELEYLGGDFILRTEDRDSSDWEFDAELYY
jgi:hypothetical protein